MIILFHVLFITFITILFHTMTDERAYSWSCSPEQCADAIAPFFESGRIDYGCPGDGPADVTKLTELTTEILHMVAHMPKLNARWKQYAKGVIILMNDGRYTPKPTTVVQRKLIAEEEATKLRAIALHIRRQWYMGRVPDWMTPFARPVAVARLAAADTAPAVVAAGPPRVQPPVPPMAEVQPPPGFVWSYDDLPKPKNAAPRLENLSITGPKALAKSRKRDYPEVPTLRECLRFAIPALGIYCAGPLMSLIDAAFVGRASSLQLASLGPASSISDSAPLPLLFLSIGATNLVARAHGRGDLRAQALTTRVGLALGVAGALVLGALVLGFSTPLSSLYCGGSLLLTPPCVAYVRIRALALPAVVVASIAQAENP